MIPIARPLIDEDEKEAVLEVLDSGQLAQGSKVREFEARFAELCGVRYAIATTSGTSAPLSSRYMAIRLPFLSLIRKGDLEFVGIISNQDNQVTSFYDYGRIMMPEDKMKYLNTVRTL